MTRIYPTEPDHGDRFSEMWAKYHDANRKPTRPSWWFLTAMALAFFGFMLLALAGAAVGGKAIEKAAFYHVNSDGGW